MEDFLAGSNTDSMNSLNVVFSLLPLLSFSFLGFSFFLFVEYAVCVCLEYAVITSLLMFWCFLPDLSQLSFYTLGVSVLHLSCGRIFRPALKQAHWTERVWNRVP